MPTIPIICPSEGQHCCWLGHHGVCQYLAPSVRPGWVWDCTLRLHRNNWAEVHACDEYQQNVRPILDELGVVPDCGDYGCTTSTTHGCYLPPSE